MAVGVEPVDHAIHPSVFRNLLIVLVLIENDQRRTTFGRRAAPRYPELWRQLAASANMVTASITSARVPNPILRGRSFEVRMAMTACRT